MELNEYQKRAMTTCTDSSRNFAYMMLNLVGEIGELSSKIAKRIRKGYDNIDENNIISVVPASKEDVAELRKEAGDVLWQLAGLCTVMGWDLEDIARQNLSKLADRKRRGVIASEGDNR